GALSYEVKARQLLGVGEDAVGVDVEPVLEQRGVDRAEVDGVLEVPVTVEAAGKPGELADHLVPHVGAHQEADAGGTVVGPVRVVLLGAASELAPQKRHDAAAETADLEV